MTGSTSDNEEDKKTAVNRIILGLAVILTLGIVLPEQAQSLSAGEAKLAKNVKNGKKQFQENCEACHQADAIGKPGIAPSLTNLELLSISSDTFIMGTILDGREDAGMPPFAHLGRRNVRHIVSYLRSHAKVPNRAAAVDAQPRAQGDPGSGKQLYVLICSTCHGSDGNGYESEGAGTAIGLPGFLNKVSDGFIRETVKYGRSNTRMLGFSGPKGLANLTDQEIDDIIVYLRRQMKQ